MRNFTNGEIVDKETGMKRPFTIMLNNISEAVPQYGIRCADIIYEAEVEAVSHVFWVFSVMPARLKGWVLSAAPDTAFWTLHMMWTGYIPILAGQLWPSH